jgi:prolyl-tRNA synthetase
MNKTPTTAITPTRGENYPEWYQQVIRAAELAEISPVRGCMVIRPWGYAIWENVQKILDGMFKATGHVNAYFPLFIPISYLQKEAEHVEGFAKECAVVTHHRLKPGKDGKLVPDGELEEPLIVRPTSETIIGATYAKWVRSYRDLPILINQWANVVRWEMRPRLFLRTAEFLWQEGHTVHATPEEAMEETLKMLEVYNDFAHNYLAIPVIKGEKTAAERFPGAVNTYTIEAMMQDRKALQAGTSHFLGQNFSKASEIKFLNQEGKEVFAWTTSWGVSTRLIGALIMTHSDDDGLILPPKMAPKQVVILPISRNDTERVQVMAVCEQLKSELEAQQFAGEKIRVEIDSRDLNGGEKAWYHIKRGVPIRLEIGPRDVQAGSVFMGRRDLPTKEKKGVPMKQFVEQCAAILTEIQNTLLQRATELRDSNTRKIDSLKEFEAFFTAKNQSANSDDDDDARSDLHGGFALCHFADGDLDPKVGELLKKLKVSTRCIPLAGEKEAGKCLFTGKPSSARVIFAKAY